MLLQMLTASCRSSNAQRPSSTDPGQEKSPSSNTCGARARGVRRAWGRALAGGRNTCRLAATRLGPAPAARGGLPSPLPSEQQQATDACTCAIAVVKPGRLTCWPSSGNPAGTVRGGGVALLLRKAAEPATQRGGERDAAKGVQCSRAAAEERAGREGRQLTRRPLDPRSRGLHWWQQRAVGRQRYQAALQVSQVWFHTQASFLQQAGGGPGVRPAHANYRHAARARRAAASGSAPSAAAALTQARLGLADLEGGAVGA